MFIYFHWKPYESQTLSFSFQIYFWEFQLQNETERLRTLFLPELGVKLKNLTGYTTYMICVAAFNAAGDGPRSLPTRGRTQQAGESRKIQTWTERLQWSFKRPEGFILQHLAFCSLWIYISYSSLSFVNPPSPCHLHNETAHYLTTSLGGYMVFKAFEE